MNLRQLSLIALVQQPALSWAQAGVATETGSVAQVVLGLGIVLALLVGSLWLLKRLTAPRGLAAGFLKVVTAAAVGPRERVVVVEVGEVWLVLGVAPGHVSALHQMPRQALPAGAPSIPGEFSNRLRQFMERSGGKS
jgi:flagellar protein FliO/FliZ